jgi:hypothetical protein
MGLSTPRTSFIGAGSSARLLERLSKQCVKFLKANNSEGSICSLTALSLPAETTTQRPAFPLSIDHRKIDFSTSIPPSTQRSLVGHYLKLIQPKFPLLSAEQRSNFIEQEIPLRCSTRLAAHSDRLAMVGIFAISTSLISRDSDSSLSEVAVFYRKLLRNAVEESFSQEPAVARSSCTIMALCFLAVNELIFPTCGQIWELVGRALAGMEQLRTDYHCAAMDKDDQYRRLEFCLTKLEWYMNS